MTAPASGDLTHLAHGLLFEGGSDARCSDEGVAGGTGDRSPNLGLSVATCNPGCSVDLRAEAVPLRDFPHWRARYSAISRARSSAV